MGKDFENPWGKTTRKGTVLKMSSILNSGVFPGMQGGPLEHVIAAKAIAFGEALHDDFRVYGEQVISNAESMATAFVDKGYKIISGGTNNHLMLIDLRSKGISGKDAENALIKADITVNKNMVPFDDKSPFVTSGIRIGTAAITSRGMLEESCKEIVGWIDDILTDADNESKIKEIKGKVNQFMKNFPLYAELS